MVTSNERTAADATRITRAWQDGAQAMVSGYGEQWRRMAEMSATMLQPRWLEENGLRETVEKISEGTREVTSAQVAIAGEWLRAPLWLTGSASPLDLQARYTRLFEAQRGLLRAYLDALTGWQRAMAGATERATAVAKDAVDAQTLTARRVANDVRDVQQATIEATRDAAEAARDAASRTVAQARETVARATNGVAEAADRAQTAQRPVKGNINARGEKIYHLPGQSSYERTDSETTFATEEEAQQAGFRRAQTPGGPTIKGHVNREGERIYHLPGQANYDRVDGDMLFETEEQARAAGFRPAQR